LTFQDFPISSKTLQGLSKAKFQTPTDIQAATLPHALYGRDILGAAKTGSGKTLAFIIPIFERLFLERWDLQDGLAAIIVTPTRELALQIFEVLRLVGKRHQLSAGLVTGGKKEFEEEQARVIKMNILVATPGRLLQVRHSFSLSPPEFFFLCSISNKLQDLMPPI
jgi:ATP-dependent RNA helicase DDX10/DBP4